MQDLLAELGGSRLAIILAATVGLIICITIEQAQLLAKYIGARRGRIAGGYNAAMKIMVVNRVGAAIYFLTIAMSIDLGMSADAIAVFFIGAVAVIALFDLAIYFELRRRQSNAKDNGQIGASATGPVAIAMIATVFGILGLTLPMLLSAANPALRLTMANTGFILNSVFTVLTVFFVESHVAKVIDQPERHDSLKSFVAAVFLMRFLAAVAALVLLVYVAARPQLLDLSWLLPGS